MNAAELRAAILAIEDLPKEPVATPKEWVGVEGQLFVRGLTSDEKDSYLGEVTDLTSGEFRPGGATALLVVRTLVDEKGERIFSDDDAKALGGKSASAVAELFKVAARLSAFSQEEVDAAEQDFAYAQSAPTATSSR